jgi:PIN domain nuclease of toxin-antitoxin system
MVVLSAAVIWEMRVKQALGKLKIAQDFFDVIKQQGFEPIKRAHSPLLAAGSLQSDCPAQNCQYVL